MCLVWKLYGCGRSVCRNLIQRQHSSFWHHHAYRNDPRLKLGSLPHRYPELKRHQ
nr:MAG TPA: hypothetical protein [Bacteriophage sp.]